MADILNYNPTVTVFPSKPDSHMCEFINIDDGRCQQQSTAVLSWYTFDIHTDAAEVLTEYACPDHIQDLFGMAEQVFDEYQSQVYDELQQLKQQFF